MPIGLGRGAWESIARLYYTLEITGDLVRLEADVFRAIHTEKINLFEAGALSE
ncbi:MAG: hypothetical protein IPP59_20295 [Betaproteobacteria bacterium]|nr:hypothetical protein [Candidatus Dechloromonas phosphorivorans]